MLGKAGLGLPTPVRAHRLNQYLEGYDGLLRDTLVKGFSSGFRIPSTKINDLDLGKIHNHPSALSHPRFVSDKLNREAAMGRIRGLFLSPTPPYVILSPLGVLPKKGDYMPVWRVQFGACQFGACQFDVTHFGAIPLWRVPL